MKSLLAAVAALAITAAAAPAMAQPDMSPAVKSGPPSVDWPIQDLVADPALKAVVDKHLPGIEANQYYDMIKSMSIRSVAKFPEAHIDDAKLAAIQADLAAVPAPAAAH